MGARAERVDSVPSVGDRFRRRLEAKSERRRSELDGEGAVWGGGLVDLVRVCVGGGCGLCGKDGGVGVVVTVVARGGKGEGGDGGVG